jgi:hypothetical protein
MEGLNIWPAGKNPEVHVRENLIRKRTETTVGHEIRELIEIAFGRVDPDYIGLDTADNDKMNGESDQFASCLLMESEATKSLLHRLGFDLPRFGRETGRSLSSVVLRLQWLFSAASGETQPYCGIWLFEAPWEEDRGMTIDLSLVAAKYDAKLCGFSQSRSKGLRSQIARDRLPSKGMALSDFELGMDAVRDREPKVAYMDGFDLFGEQNFTLIAEPLFDRRGGARLLLVAVRNESACFKGWASRLPIRASSVGSQR